ncbi:hypothetical protein AN958_01897 [Leucoagaricus sp. SymC.cos]|nr:hypothetical protein AN958_01897 [Leucoagaricus sp. SymC.cos]
MLGYYHSSISPSYALCLRALASSDFVRQLDEWNYVTAGSRRCANFGTRRLKIHLL